MFTGEPAQQVGRLSAAGRKAAGLRVPGDLTPAMLNCCQPGRKGQRQVLQSLGELSSAEIMEVVYVEPALGR